MKRIDKIKLFCFSCMLTAVGCLFSACSDNDTITPKTFEEYKQEYKQFVDSEILRVESCLREGYNKGELREYRVVNLQTGINDTGYTFETIKTDYLIALLEASRTIEEHSTITEIVESNQKISESGARFGRYYNLVDLRPLQNAILVAEELRDATSVGTEIGQVSQGAKTVFEQAISDARGVRNSARTTDDFYVTRRIEILGTATAAFRNAIVK